MSYMMHDGYDPFYDGIFGDWDMASMKFPPVDVYEDGNGYILEAELPGYRSDEIDMHVENHVLHISSKKNNSESQGKKYLMKERSYHRFERSFSLPESVREEAIAASFHDGVLSVTIPKEQKVEPKRIPVAITK